MGSNDSLVRIQMHGEQPLTLVLEATGDAPRDVSAI